MPQLGGAPGGGATPRRKPVKSLKNSSPVRRDPNNRAMPPRRSQPTSRTSSRSSSFNTPSYGGGGGSIRSNSSGSYGAVPSPPSSARPGPVQSIEAYLGGDSSYQQQLRQLAKAFNDFSADATRRKGVLTSEYGVSKKALGDQRTMDLEALEDDYGARGLIRSGLYGDAVGDYEKEYGLRVGDLDRRQQQALQQLLQEQSAFGQQNKLSKQAAREAAIRRRAENLGV